jgi:phosphatidate cytidylyltransferase
VLQRIKTALILLPLLLAVVLFMGEWGTALVMAAASVFAIREFLVICSHRTEGAEEWIIPFWGVLITLSFLWHLDGLAVALVALGTVFYLVIDATKRGMDAATLSRVTTVTSAWVLVPLFLGHAVIVRSFGPEALIFLMILVMAGDAAAYFVGSAIGKRKLSPKISPNKSIEGSLGGLVVTALCGMFFSTLFELPHTSTEGFWIGAGVNIVAQVGDLAESALKRAAGVKDSGDLIPGHGGMLDRVDSFIPTLPLYAAILTAFGGQ